MIQASEIQRVLDISSVQTYVANTDSCTSTCGLARSTSTVSPHPLRPSAAAPGAEEVGPPRHDPGVGDPAGAGHQQRADVQQEEMDLDLNLPPQVVIYLDLNFSLDEEEEEDVQILEAKDVHMPEAEDVHIPEAKDVQIPVVHAHRRDLPDSHRFATYIALKALGNVRSIEKADKELVATLLKTSLSTIERIWRKAREQEIKELEVDVSNQKKERCGRKRADLGLSRMPSIPLNKRSTLRALARELGVAYATLQRRFQWGKIRRHTSTLKPALKPENKIARLKFCTSMIDQKTIAVAEPSFLSMENIVHIDEMVRHDKEEQKILSTAGRTRPHANYSQQEQYRKGYVLNCGGQTPIQ
ncbi:hypothetical protein ACQ4PT_005698 [Festuca glaucescens]